MKPSEIKDLLRFAVPNGQNVLLVGAPGIGKTAIVNQIADELGCTLVVTTPGVEDPTVPAGFPFPDRDTGTAKFLPFGSLARAMSAVERVIWFCDDFGQAPRATQAAYMPLLQGGVGDHTLPEHVTFVGATNGRDHNAHFQGLLDPVKSRFATIITMEADLEESLAWGMAHGWPPEYVAWLRYRPELLSPGRPDGCGDFDQYPSPRSHHFAQRWLACPNELIRRAAIVGAIGAGAESELFAFVMLAKELPDLDAMIADPTTFTWPEQPGLKLAMIAGLAHRAKREIATPLMSLAAKILDTGDWEYGRMMVQDCIRQCPDFDETKAFADFAAGPYAEVHEEIHGGG